MASGKSTLCRLAQQDPKVVLVAEYMDFIKDHPAFYTKNEDARLSELLDVEKNQRKDALEQALKDDNIEMIVMDRSYLTLFAHDFAMGHESAAIKGAASVCNGSAVIKPDLIVYLDVDEKTRQQRYKQRGDEPLEIVEFMLSDCFNNAFKKFMTEKQDHVPVSVVDTATTSSEAIFSKMKEALKSFKGGRNTPTAPPPKNAR